MLEIMQARVHAAVQVGSIHSISNSNPQITPHSYINNQLINDVMLHMPAPARGKYSETVAHRIMRKPLFFIHLFYIFFLLASSAKPSGHTCWHYATKQ